MKRVKTSGFGRRQFRAVAVIILASVLLGVLLYSMRQTGDDSTKVPGDQRIARVLTTVKQKRDIYITRKGNANREAPAAPGLELYNDALQLEKTESNFVRSRNLLKEAAALGYAPAMYRLGNYAENGLGEAVDFTAAMDFYLSAANSGAREGFTAIARMLLAGNITNPNSELASDYLNKGIEAGSNAALFLKGTMLIDAHSTSKEGFELIVRAAEADNPDALRMIASFYRKGEFVSRDLERAEEFSQLAYELGSMEAGVDLAELMMNKTSYKEAKESGQLDDALRRLKLASEAGTPRAASLLTSLELAALATGSGDVGKTREIAREAFAGGDPASALVIAATYASDSDADAVNNWLTAGAEKGDWRSAYARSLIYEDGINPRDAITAAFKATVEEYAARGLERMSKNTQGTSSPVPTSMPMPAYPSELKAVAADGNVTAQFLVNEKGFPVAVSILSSSHPQLAEAAAAAITNWRFRPAMRNGKPVAVSMQIPIQFKMPR